MMSLPHSPPNFGFIYVAGHTYHLPISQNMATDKIPEDADSGSRRRSGRGSVKRTYAESEGTDDSDEHEEEKPVTKSRSQRATSSTSAKPDKGTKKKKTQLSPEFIEGAPDPRTACSKFQAHILYWTSTRLARGQHRRWSRYQAKEDSAS